MRRHLCGAWRDDNVLIRFRRLVGRTLAVRGRGPRDPIQERSTLELPEIALDCLPSLADAPGIVGSLSDLATATTDDRLVYLMVFLYETFPPETLF